MKKIAIQLFSLSMALMLCMEVQAQASFPAPSPSSMIKQSVGVGEIIVEYSRPSMKGRKIMGALVPYGKLWRTGANTRTKITFTEDVKLEGTAVAAGSYSLQSIPGKSEWEIILSTTVDGGPGSLAEDEETIRFKVTPMEMPVNIESFTIMFNDLRDDGATLNMMWEKTAISIGITVDTDSKVMAGIERMMAGPTPNQYYSAAQYYYNHNKDPDKALEFVNKALKGGDRFWIMTLKARIQRKMGDKMGALATSKKALTLAKEANNGDYVKINEDMIAALQ